MISKREERERWKEKQQRDSESRLWVLKDEMLLEHFVFKDPNIFRFLRSEEQISHIHFYFHFLFSPLLSDIFLYIRSILLLLLKVIVLEMNKVWQLFRAECSQSILF